MESLLFLHGALGDATQFDDLRARLAGEWHTLALNFPGHGDAPAAGQFSIDAFARAALRFLDEQGVRQPIAVFGYSMGGYVALRMALLAPERLRVVATLGTKFDWTPETAAREAGRLDPERMVERVPAFAEALTQRHRAQDWRDVVRQTADLLRRLGAGEALREADLRRVTCPVRIGLGERDQLVSLEESEQAARWLPNARLERLPDLPHPIEQVPVEALAQWVRSALAP
jgi:pimeloyl-ACP methyl ester carboxylesterase